MVVSSGSRSDQFRIASSENNSPVESSWIAQMMEAQQKGKGVQIPKEEFKVTTYWEETRLELHNKKVLLDFGHVHRNSGTEASVEGGGGDSSSGGHRVLAGKKAGEKRRKKTISLQDLRQYFAGSLKDAAKSIGVCPTTLKRICRQHGINRWPSRKIKKVGHSLRKLQAVIDSVHGAEGAIRIDSFYSSFLELSSPNLTSEPQLDSGMFIRGAASSKSRSSSSSQSSGSSTCSSTRAKQQSTSTNAVEDPGGTLNSVLGYAESHSPSRKTIGEHPNFETRPRFLKSFGRNLSTGGALRVKAMFGEAKIQFVLQPSWGFIDLQQEIMKRFNIEDTGKIDLKYLDDDVEWVLLTCDADLEECIDIYKSAQCHTIRISLHQASNPSLRQQCHHQLCSFW
ncbi:Plant regulator RWP-RK family protein, putative isoform 2 [Hibiscus syriacus]|uniref:Plant regulator RWP-RK family protein, putative isoform 2 n=1 Tax=Hibiscus syriacus TaxID=106335 RepID=A0A6A2XN11_HIBSY|nr:protein NLP2-like [Hibiscus syriacus]KAE8668345.1 Plant regulator RWP-RK family protein, putative isoform 2 [Hibiscus syriacus]